MAEGLVDAFFKDYKERELGLVARLACHDAQCIREIHTSAKKLPDAVLNIIGDWAVINWNEELLKFCQEVRSGIGLKEGSNG